MSISFAVGGLLFVEFLAVVSALHGRAREGVVPRATAAMEDQVAKVQCFWL
jgi:hypothetical protein